MPRSGHIRAFPIEFMRKKIGVQTNTKMVNRAMINKGVYDVIKAKNKLPAATQKHLRNCPTPKDDGLADEPLAETKPSMQVVRFTGVE